MSSVKSLLVPRIRTELNRGIKSAFEVGVYGGLRLIATRDSWLIGEPRRRPNDYRGIDFWECGAYLGICGVRLKRWLEA